MKRILLIISAAMLSAGAEASWYWPFGDSEPEPPRLSELVRNASDLITDASDLAADGKTSDAVAKYKEALVELDRVERENPTLAQSTSYGTLRTKRAYVEAAIDALLLDQARKNAKSVAVSDTAELEKRLAAERKGAAAEDKGAEVVSAPTAENPVVREVSKQPKQAKSAKKRPTRKAEPKKAAPARPLTPREEAMKAIAEGDFAKAGQVIDGLLEAKPNDAAALNLRAAKETAEGKYPEAEKTLDRAIRSNPRDHFAYYNMAVLKLQTRADDKDGARRYYETGRAYGGPRDAEIEELLK